MTINVSDYPDVKARALKLELEPPTDVTFLPRHFLGAENKSELLNESSVATLRTLFRSHDIKESRLDSVNARFPSLHENSFDWIAPVIFFSASYISENQNAISIACGIIANYITDYFKGVKNDPSVKLEMVIETTKTKKTKKLLYEGNVQGIKELAVAIKEIVSE